MASRKIQTYQNKAKNLYTIYFVFDLNGECKFIKTKQNFDIYVHTVEDSTLMSIPLFFRFSGVAKNRP